MLGCGTCFNGPCVVCRMGSTVGKTIEVPGEQSMDPAGGQMASVCIQWFNAGNWKRRYYDPKHTYVVAFVTKVDRVQRTAHLLIIGDEAASTFVQTFDTFRSCRDTWIAHGKPMSPVYVLAGHARTTIWFDEDCSQVVKTKKGIHVTRA